MSSLIADTDEILFNSFHKLPARASIDIHFKNISYYVRTGFLTENKKILHKINGKFPNGQLITIMGPSGSGKSTLLNVLSGFKRNNITGSIYINGQIRDLDTFRKMSCYITQEDVLEELLTVIENMQIAASLKLSKKILQDKKDLIIKDILIGLGLYEVRNSLTKILSGGQKKRLSIALELINNPSVMFLDEPTTGLDNVSCNKLVSLLKILAAQGRTIICTIHQPSAKSFKEFDQLYLISRGICLYQGTPSNTIPYLKHLGFPCPIQYNPADYVIELASAEYGENKIEIMNKEIKNGENLNWLDSDVLNTFYTFHAPPEKPLPKPYLCGFQNTSHSNQLLVLLKRECIKTTRDTTLTFVRVGVNIAIPLMLGSLFINAGNEGSRVRHNYHLLFAILLHHMLMSKMLTVLTFPTARKIVVKERFNRWYSLKMYYTSITLIDIPISFFCCLIFTCIIYVMSAQPMELHRFIMFLTISELTVFIAQGVGLTIGAWFNVVNGTFIGPILCVLCMMFSGFSVYLSDIPWFLSSATHITYLRYSLEGLVGSIYGGNRSVLNCEQGTKYYCHYRYPNILLEEISMNGENFYFDLIWLIVIFIVIRLIGYYVLRLKIMLTR